VYVPVPEKYFTPSSELSLHDANLSSVIFAGVPRSGWKLRSQAPSTVAIELSVTLGRVRDGVFAGLRKTTKTVPQESRCRGTVMRPSKA